MTTDILKNLKSIPIGLKVALMFLLILMPLIVLPYIMDPTFLDHIGPEHILTSLLLLLLMLSLVGILTQQMFGFYALALAILTYFIELLIFILSGYRLGYNSFSLLQLTYLALMSTSIFLVWRDKPYLSAKKIEYTEGHSKGLMFVAIIFFIRMLSRMLSQHLTYNELLFAAIYFILLAGIIKKKRFALYLSIIFLTLTAILLGITYGVYNMNPYQSFPSESHRTYAVFIPLFTGIFDFILICILMMNRKYFKKLDIVDYLAIICAILGVVIAYLI